LERHLNIISFNIPYPADYGGVIDVYYKIKWLFKNGVKVHLHCYEYDREPAPELEEICSSVQYYRRKTGYRYFMKSSPYIVNTRFSEDLIKNIGYNNYPILFEGLHTTSMLNHEAFSGRKKIVRTHNVEHNYYNQLADIEKKWSRRIFFRKEAVKLERHERILVVADGIAAISPNDCGYFNDKYKKATFIPAFHPNDKVKCKEGRGNYILYHGNLSVGENVKAANYLIECVFSKLKGIPVKIAGKNPDKSIFINATKHLRDYEIVSNPTHERMNDLIENAHINILPTFQSTGIKLKLLAALFSGRHCIVNKDMVDNTGLQDLCSVKDTPDDMIKEINRLFHITFTHMQIESRTEKLNFVFSNQINADKIIDLIYS